VQSLRDYVNPIIGALPVESITTEHVLKVLEPLWAKYPETASRCRGRIESVLDFAKFTLKFSWADGGNPARWAGNLEHQPRFQRKAAKNFAALPWTEAAGFMVELRATDDVIARALEFCILSATRTNETIGAAWGEFDLQARTWRIPVGSSVSSAAARKRTDHTPSRCRTAPLRSWATCTASGAATACFRSDQKRC
jgi:integrase